MIQISYGSTSNNVQQFSNNVFYSTFVIISAVVAVLFKQHTAVLAVPAVSAATLPLTVLVDSALPVSWTAVRTPFLCAVLAVPSSHTQACAVLALPMLITPAQVGYSYRLVQLVELKHYLWKTLFRFDYTCLLFHAIKLCHQLLY